MRGLTTKERALLRELNVQCHARVAELHEVPVLDSLVECGRAKVDGWGWSITELGRLALRVCQ